MNEIDHVTLRNKLATDTPPTLVMVASEWAYRAKRIPGSRHFARLDDALSHLDPDAEIVLYCGGEHCNTSRHAYRVLEAEGFSHLWHYAGGLSDWEAAGYPLDGEWAIAR